jgi:hypothetical protein
MNGGMPGKIHFACQRRRFIRCTTLALAGSVLGLSAHVTAKECKLAEQEILGAMDEGCPMSSLHEVHNMADTVRLDESLCAVIGEYRAVPRPVRGNIASPQDYAVVVLADATEVFLGVFGTPEAERGAEERQRFAGRRVQVIGTIHHRMPASGQSPLAPCVSNIVSVKEIST